MSTLARENVRAFLARDWSLARITKDVAIGRATRRRGTAAAFALERALNDQVWERALNERDDRAELVALVHLISRLRRAQS